MKKLAFGLLFGVIGLVFQWVMPLIIGMLIPGDDMQRHGEDEAGRQLMAYFLFGGALFFVLWAWIGSTFVRNWRKASWMAVGVVFATAAIVLLPRLVLPSHVRLDDWRYDAAFVAVWAASSALLAYVMGKLAPEANPN